MLSCRCPACVQVLFLDEHVHAGMWICCDNCDRGVRPHDALCAECFARNPFEHGDPLFFACSKCGDRQPDYAAKMTA